MASSRWKRFAFFDRHTLNLPSPVLEDLLPPDADREGVCMVVNTAALPSNTTTTSSSNVNDDIAVGGVQPPPLKAMWSSLTACSEPSNQGETESTTTTIAKKTIHLPSQQQQTSSSTTTSTAGSDGLVLLWLASPKSPYIHCIDVSLRCCGDLEHVESDGWRGYFMGSSRENGIVHVATCRMPSTNGQHAPLYVACLTPTSLEIHIDPHLNLSCRLPVITPSTTTTDTTSNNIISLTTPWNESTHGRACTMDMIVADGTQLLAVGTDLGYVLIYEFTSSDITLQWTIPPPPITQGSGAVTCVKLNSSTSSIFCAFQKGIFCFEFASNGNITARHDLDSRPVLRDSVVDYAAFSGKSENGGVLVVARPDGLYSYSKTSKVAVSPIDGTKNAISVVPPPSDTKRSSSKTTTASSYALVASTDVKSGRYVMIVGIALHI